MAIRPVSALEFFIPCGRLDVSPWKESLRGVREVKSMLTIGLPTREFLPRHRLLLDKVNHREQMASLVYGIPECGSEGLREAGG